MKLLATLVTGAAAFSLPDNKRPTTHHVQYIRQHSGECEIIASGATQMHRGLKYTDHVIVERKEQQHELHENLHHDVITTLDSRPQLVEAFSWDQERAWQHTKRDCSAILETASVDEEGDVDDEVFDIIIGGPADNRIDVVFMGDGYTRSERQKHIDDMERLTKDMFEDVTFDSYLPLFNIYGVYRESNESGVGTHNTARDTAFRLYRSGTELRGLYAGNAQAARNACSKAPGCDYPSLIGNDPYYGGLGGEFTISTSSDTSGTVVLRHEMGHNFASVGEEYDGGSAYFGANNANSLNNAKNTWGVWMTDIDNLREETARQLSQDYAWHDLGQGEYTININSQGHPRWLLRFSVSGAETQDSFEVLLDDRVLPWSTSSNLDRSFSEFTEANTGISLTSGQHTLRFRQLTPPAAGNDMRQLCSVSMHEFGAEPDFHQDDEFYMGAYPTWNMIGMKSYRPGNEHCLMRNMQSRIFCDACQESIWHQFLKRMTLIDDVEVSSADEEANVQLHPVGLAQFREEPVDGEEYQLRWSRNGVDLPELNDQFQFAMNFTDARGSWEASLQLVSPEVRQDLDALLFTHSFDIN